MDNHDTGGSGASATSDQGRMKDGSSDAYGQGHWRFPPEKRLVGYAYVLTHPGVPCLFWPHCMWLDEKHRALSDGVKELCAVRRAAGVRANSEVKILVAESDCYAARVVGNERELAVKLGPRYDPPPDLIPEKGCLLYTSDAADE